MEAIKREDIQCDDIIEYCPWQLGDISHRCDAACEGSYCDEAYGKYLDTCAEGEDL